MKREGCQQNRPPGNSDDGKFVVRMPNGTQEKGTYTFENGKLMLNCGSGRVEVEAENSFTYIAMQDGQAYTFFMTTAWMNKLINGK